MAMYSASVIDCDVTSCLRDVHIIGTPFRVTRIPDWDRTSSPPYAASAYIFIRASRLPFGVCISIPSFPVKAKYCTNCLAVSGARQCLTKGL